MSLLPFIQQPCPYLNRLDEAMEGDFCKMCKRQVHDLSALDDAGKTDFLAACEGKACISYRFDVRPAVSAALMAAGAAVMIAEPAMAAPRHGVTRPRHPPRVPPPPHIEMVPMMTAGVPPPMTVPNNILPNDPPPSSVQPSSTPK